MTPDAAFRALLLIELNNNLGLPAVREAAGVPFADATKSDIEAVLNLLPTDLREILRRKFMSC
jgi:hypothetical protein